MIKNFLMTAMLLAAITLMGCGQQISGDGVTFQTSPLTIITQDGQQHNFMMEVAQTEQQQSYGLMFREELADDHGMIFLFSDEEMRGFWMKNTLIFLDIIFVNKAGTIVMVHSMAQPHDRTMISSDLPAKAVIEVRGGLTTDLGIKAGDRIQFKGF